MNENNSSHKELRLIELLNENIARDVCLFVLLYLFLLAQGWDALLLHLYPIISFCFALFFRIISTNKRKLTLERNAIQYNPLGAENKISDRLFFISLIQLILLFWIGAESLYHPQLIDDFNFYFSLVFFLIYSFGYYWIFTGMWKYCKIVIDLENLDDNEDQFTNIVISELNINQIKLITYSNVIIFVSLNFLNYLLIMLDLLGIKLSLPYFLPGTGIEDSQPLQLPFTSLIILIAFPLMTSIFLRLIYNDINSFSITDFKTKTGNLPSEVKDQIIENLKSINTKLFDKDTE